MRSDDGYTDMDIDLVETKMDNMDSILDDMDKLVEQLRKLGRRYEDKDKAIYPIYKD